MSSAGAKRFNKNKVDLALLPEVAAYEECKVWMFGEKKYGRDNWKQLWDDKSVDVATASLLRHALSLASGELFDNESGFPHASHIRCNAAMILEYMAREKMITPKVYKEKERDEDIIMGIDEVEVIISMILSLLKSYLVKLGTKELAHYIIKEILKAVVKMTDTPLDDKGAVVAIEVIEGRGVPSDEKLEELVKELKDA